MTADTRSPTQNSTARTPAAAGPAATEPRRRARVNGRENRRLFRYAVAVAIALVLLVVVFNRIGPDGLYFSPEHRGTPPAGAAPEVKSDAGSNGPWHGAPTPLAATATAVAALQGLTLSHPLGTLEGASQH